MSSTTPIRPSYQATVTLSTEIHRRKPSLTKVRSPSVRTVRTPSITSLAPHVTLEDDGDDDEEDTTFNLFQNKERSESFDDTLTIDVEPLLPSLITIEAAESLVQLQPHVLNIIPTTLAEALLVYFSPSGLESQRLRLGDPNIQTDAVGGLDAIPFVFKDPVKFLFDDWHFSFSVTTAPVSNSPKSNSDYTENSGREGSSKSSSTVKLPAIESPRQPKKSLSEEASEMTSTTPRQRQDRQHVSPPPPTESNPSPISFVKGLCEKLRKQAPKVLTIESLPLGSSPYALGYLAVVGLSNAPLSLSKLHLPFCGISSHSLLTLVGGLYAASDTQVYLTDLDLSYNALTPSSIPLIAMLLTSTKIVSLSLRGNHIGTAVHTDAEVNSIATNSVADAAGGNWGEVNQVKRPLVSNKHGFHRTTAGILQVGSPRRHPQATQEPSPVSSLPSQPANAKAHKKTTFGAFVQDACSRVEYLDMGFTDLSPSEQELLIDAIANMGELHTLKLDGLKLTPNNAAKLAVAVGNSRSLWDVSVNYNINCTSKQYLEKIRVPCEQRREAAHLPKLRRMTTMRSSQVMNSSGIMDDSSTSSSSPTKQPCVKALMADRNFLKMEGMQWIDDWALTEGYGVYTTNDPSLKWRKKQSSNKTK